MQKNIITVREALFESLQNQQNGTQSVQQSESIANTCGKLINTFNFELKFYEIRKEKPPEYLVQQESKPQ